MRARSQATCLVICFLLLCKCSITTTIISNDIWIDGAFRAKFLRINFLYFRNIVALDQNTSHFTLVSHRIAPGVYSSWTKSIWLQWLSSLWFDFYSFLTSLSLDIMEFGSGFVLIPSSETSTSNDKVKIMNILNMIITSVKY